MRANYLTLTASPDKWNQTYNIGTGVELTAEEAGKILCKVVGYKGEIEVKPQRGVDPDRFAYNIDKASNMLNFKTQYSFEEGLKDML